MVFFVLMSGSGRSIACWGEALWAASDHHRKQ